MGKETHSVLVVDDDKDIREIICDVLNDEGYRTVAAADGEEALELLRHGGPYCLVLLDLMMPVKDGWTFRQEQQADPAIADVPVFVVTAAGSPDRTQLGAIKGILHKPVNFKDLLGAVQAFC